MAGVSTSRTLPSSFASSRYLQSDTGKLWDQSVLSLTCDGCVLKTTAAFCEARPGEPHNIS